MARTDSNEPQPRMRMFRAGQARRTVLAAFGLLVVGLLGVSVYGFASPKPCASCHNQPGFRAATRASGHAQVDCRECHLAPGVLGQVVFAANWPAHAYLPPGRAVDRDAASVPDRRCRMCHEDALKTAITARGVRIDHSSCAGSMSCTTCHSTTAHGSSVKWARTYEMDMCIGCHRKNNRMACDLCHPARTQTARVASTAFAATHGPDWQSTHGMGDSTTCAVCHEAADCGRCHGPGVPHGTEFVREHTSFAEQPEARCGTCHEPAFCTSCHGIEMPHPADFTPRHLAAAGKDRKVCDRCHDKSDCTECHLKHVHPGGSIGATVSAGGGGQ